MKLDICFSQGVHSSSIWINLFICTSFVVNKKVTLRAPSLHISSPRERVGVEVGTHCLGLDLQLWHVFSALPAERRKVSPMMSSVYVAHVVVDSCP